MSSAIPWAALPMMFAVAGREHDQVRLVGERDVGRVDDALEVELVDHDPAAGEGLER
jgi:hypothetical protein